MKKLLFLSFMLYLPAYASLESKINESDLAKHLTKVKKLKSELFACLELVKSGNPSQSDLAAIQEKLKEIKPIQEQQSKLQSLLNPTTEPVDSESKKDEDDDRYVYLNGDLEEKIEDIIPKEKQPRKQLLARQHNPKLFPVNGHAQPVKNLYNESNESLKKRLFWCTIHVQTAKTTNPKKTSKSSLSQNSTTEFLEPNPSEKYAARTELQVSSILSRSMINLLKNASSEDLEKMRANQKEWEARQKAKESEEKKCSSGTVSL